MDQCVIYKIINVVNGKFYVGSTINFYSRTSLHRKRLRSGKHHTKHLQAAWNKYGEEAFIFVVVEKVADPSKLFEAETRWLQEHVGKEYCYNSAKHADTPMRGIPKEQHPSFGVPKSEEHRKQISETLKTYYAADPANHPRAGKRHTAETRAKISEKVRSALEHGGAGKYVRSEETRAKLSASLKGSKGPLGYKRTPEERAAISERMKGTQLWLGKKHTIESRLKMGKPVVAVLPDGSEKQYPTIGTLAQEYNVPSSMISRAVISGKPLQKGKLKGYAFRYA